MIKRVTKTKAAVTNATVMPTRIGMFIMAMSGGRCSVISGVLVRSLAAVEFVLISMVLMIASTLREELFRVEIFALLRT